DGNKVNTDACTDACQAATCGDGITWTGMEGCDDGNKVNTDACTDACKAATCGDGITWTGMEGWDDGNVVDDDGCTNACKLPSCSDGIKNQGEAQTDCGGPCQPCSVEGLVINEVDYDQVGGDTAEFIEILNTTGAPIDLTGYHVIL